MVNLDARASNSGVPLATVPKSWYPIVGEHFEGGVTDEASASQLLREKSKQPVMEKEPPATSTPAPAPRPQPASKAPAKAAASIAKADTEYAPTATTFAAPLYAPEPPDQKFSETDAADAQAAKTTPGRAQSKNSTAKWIATAATMTLVAFAAGQAQTFEGFGALQLAESGIGKWLHAR
eukprot:702429-Pleurochrysis_carterae.AAC.1